MELQYRTIEIRKEDIIEEERAVDLSFSSEMPVQRTYGYEILDHTRSSVDLKRLNTAAPLLLDHDTTKQIGVVDKAYIAGDRKGRAVVRFSRSGLGEEIFNDVRDGIRKNISVGYAVNRMDEVEKDSETKISTFRVMSWTPLEVSVVSIPADETVGVGRNIKNTEVNKMSEEIKVVEKVVEVEKAPAVDVRAEVEKAKNDEKVRIREISALGLAHKMDEISKQYIDEGRSINEFREAVLDKLQKNVVTPVDSSPAGEIGLSEREKKNFSIVRAVRAIVNNDWSIAPFEKEASDATGKKLNKQARGFFIPDDVLYSRDLTVGTPTSAGTGGGNLVETSLLAASFIELLRNKMVTKALGIKMLDGLQGDVLLPKQTGGGTAYWVSENSDVTEGQQTFTQVSMRPKTVGAMTDISRKLIIQSSLGIEQLVRNDLATILALELDRVIIEGSSHGTSNEPTGIIETSGIGSVSAAGGVPTYANIVELWTDIAAENADLGSMGFLTTPAMAGKLMQVFTNATYGEQPIWTGGPGDGSMLGFRAMVSNQVPTDLTSNNYTGIIFGNWADCILGSWSGVDVLVDPYTGSAAGTVRIVLMHDVDVAIRHAESFSCILDGALA